MTKNIYVVFGMTGEYDDAHDWAIAAYTDKAMAEEHAKLAYKDSVRLLQEYKGERHLIPYAANRYDKEMCMDSNGVEYTVATIPLLRSLPCQ